MLTVFCFVSRKNKLSLNYLLKFIVIKVYSKEINKRTKVAVVTLNVIIIDINDSEISQWLEIFQILKISISRIKLQLIK